MKRLLSVVALLATTACGPAWVVVKQANPDPFVGAKKFTVAVDAAGMKLNGKNEADFTAKGPEEKAGWEKSKESFTTNFLESFKAKAKDAGYEIVEADAQGAIKVMPGDIDLGYFVGISGGPSLTNITVQVATPDGNVQDEVTMRAQTPGNIYNPTPDARIRSDGIQLGKLVVKYLDNRTAAAPK